MNISFSSKKTAWVLFASSCIYPQLANASGYHFGTQSVTSQSTANASAAEAADASTIFYNPAGISYLEGTNLSLNANFVAPKVKYSNAWAKYPMPNPIDGSAIPVRGKTSGKITDDFAIAPHLYASHQLNDKFTVGLGVFIPFASGTEYDRDSVLRYNVNQMKMTAIDINPNIAYKINDRHRVSVGVMGQYMDASLRQYANWGAFAAKATKNPKLYGNADGFAEVEGNDWGMGYTLGYLWDVNDQVRVGASYRSKVEYTLEGRAKWKPDNPLYQSKGKPALSFIQSPMTAGGMGYAADEGVSVKLVTPESFSLHGKVDLDNQWTAFGDVTWTRHSRFNKIDIQFENPKVVQDAQKSTPQKPVTTISDTTTLQPNWRDSYKFSLGAAYQYTDDLQLRFGVAYDQSPVKSADYRLSTMPDNDRIWFSVGAKYDINESSSLNLGYSYIHIKDTSANVNGFCGSLSPAGASAKNCVSSRTNGSADYNDSNAHILGIQYNYRF